MSFYLTSKIRPTYSALACKTFSKSPSIYQPQQLTKASIYAKSTNIWIITKLLSYHLINLGSNRIYVLFIVELSYEDQIRNLSNIVWFFDLSLTSYNVLIVISSINQTKPSFILHSIISYVNAQTIVKPKYDIII